ncbi:squalene/phytoene synthase family protein [Teichococcus aestuarii]
MAPPALPREASSRDVPGMSAAPAAEVLAGPPTRGPGSENFPVASWLLAPALRRPVLAFYHFVRAADDIADHPELPPEEKLARLARLEAALDDPATPLPLARALHESGAGTAEARRMLSAFRQDATQRRYAGWAALEDYCARSAAPVGRLLLRLHGETDPEALAGAESLAAALQILNHLQDLGPDRAALDRVYLPQDWMALAGGEDAFFTDAAARAPVLLTALDRVEAMLDRAACLPRRLESRRPALESAVTLHLARRLLARLRATDPLAGRVALSRADMAAALLAALRLSAPALAPPARHRRRGAGAGAGEARPLLLRARHGGHARPGAARALRRLCLLPCRGRHRRRHHARGRQARWPAEWRGKLERPDCPLSRELAWARSAFALPLAECHAMIDGMEADAGPSRRIADGAALDLYCRQVAGSVGALAVRIFGAPEAEAYGLALGHAFQLVNVLRDIDEDALRERVYLPLSDLAAAGLPPDAPAAALVADPRLPAVAAALAERADAAFAAADALLPPAAPAR